MLRQWLARGACTGYRALRVGAVALLLAGGADETTRVQGQGFPQVGRPAPNALRARAAANPQRLDRRRVVSCRRSFLSCVPPSLAG